MTLLLVLAPGAVDDLQDAADFYEMQQPGLGGAFLHALDEGLDRIQIIAVWHERREPEGWKGRAEGNS